MLKLSYTKHLYLFFGIQNHECISLVLLVGNSTYIHELRLTCMCNVHSVKSNCKRRYNLEQLTTKNNRQHDLCQFIQYKIDKIKHYSFDIFRIRRYVCLVYSLTREFIDENSSSKKKTKRGWWHDVYFFIKYSDMVI